MSWPGWSEVGWTGAGDATVCPRRDLAALPAYSSARSTSPVSVRASSNEAPDGLSPAVLEAVLQRLGTINRYPQIGLTDLAATIANLVGADPEEVVVADGSLSLLNYLMLAFCAPGSVVVHPWRSYEAYPICVTTAAAVPVGVPNLPDGSHDLDAIAEAVDETTSAVIVCTPNNPTGNALPGDALARFVAQVPDHVLVIVDEAYGDFVDGEPVDTARIMTEHRNVASLRTFSKAWGLAGIRAGYLVAAPEVCSSVRKILPPFPASALAEAAIPAALADQAYHDRIVAAVRAQRRDVQVLLDAYALPHYPTQANFIWLPLGEAAAEMGSICAGFGVSTRVFPGEGVRISLGEPGLLPALEPALRMFRSY